MTSRATFTTAMNNLFEIPESHPPALIRARQRLAAAQTVYERHERSQEELGTSIPRQVQWDLQNAARDVAREENASIYFTKHPEQ